MQKAFEIKEGDIIKFLTGWRTVLGVSSTYMHPSIGSNARTLTMTSPHTRSGTVKMTIFETDLLEKR